MGLTITSVPGLEPITLAEAKEHLNYTESADDDYITSLIKAARKYAEHFQNRVFITQTWDLFCDAFPVGGVVLLIPTTVLQTIDEIKYYDTDGVEQTWSDTLYQYDITSKPARLLPEPDESYPDTQSGKMNAVQITFTAGYGPAASDVPEQTKQAMLLLIGHYYENREEVVVGVTPSAVPFAARALLTLNSLPEFY